MLNNSIEQDRTYLFRHMKVFPVYIQDYFKSKLHSLSPSTLRGYAIDIEDFLEWLIEDGTADVVDIKDIPLTTLDKLKAKKIEKDYVAFLNAREYSGGRKLKGKKLNHQTLKRKIAALRALFHWLSNVAKDETLEPLLTRNVMEELDLEQPEYDPQKVASRIRNSILVGKEFNEFRDFVSKGYGDLPNLKGLSKRKHKENKERDRAIVSLMLETGIRVLEVANINMDDLDMKSKKLKVSRKAGKSIVLDLSEPAVDDLNKYLEIRDERYMPSEGQQSLFLTNQQAPGQTMTKRAIQNMIEKYSEAYGKPLLTAHKIRYSFGVRHYAMHHDIDKLQEIMGHSDIQSTTIYPLVIGEQLENL